MSGMAMRCAGCGAEVVEGARFCPACGLALIGRVGSEERRTVTVLFADLVGSTRLGEQLDPEVMRALVDRFFQLCGADVARHGGVVQAFSGDAAVGVFGLKAAHEDDAERAVRTAVALQSAVEAAKHEWALQPGVTFAARIGIESGEVVVGDPHRGATMATGDCFNVAARLEQQAKAGEIVIGPAAFAATRGTARVEALGGIALAGKREPVQAWRVLSVAAEPGAPRGIEGLSAPLTGRDEEMALLRQAAGRTITERKAILCTLVGVPGVGKSRLVRELTNRLEADGTRVLRGRCLPYGDGITYWPLAEMCRNLADLTPSLNQAEALSRLEAVAQSRPVAERLAFAIGVTSTSPVDGSGVDKEIAWAFRRLLEVIGVDQPLALVFDDIHWAQPALLDLIEYLAAWIRGTPVMILCPTRPELLDSRSGWGGGRVEASRILLEPLSRKDSAALVEALLHVEALPASLREQILERSEGNPLFVEEVLRMLIENGTLVLEHGRWAASERTGEVSVPETVQAIIRARMDTLPHQERTLLQAASVVGRAFERSALLALLEDGESIDASLDDLVLRDLVTEDRATTERAYRFKHILIRDVAYTSVPKMRRAKWHEQFARWLPRLAAERTEILEIQAYHLETAALLQRELHGRPDSGLHQSAIEALRSAAEQAMARDDFRVARRYAERCLALSPEPEEKRLEIEWLQLEAIWRLGDFPRAAELGRLLADQAQKLGRTDLVGRALVAQATHVATTRGPSEGTALAVRARELLKSAGDAVYEYEAATLVSFRGWWAGDLDQTYQDIDETRRLAQRMGDRSRETESLLSLVAIRVVQARIAESQSLMREAIALADLSASRLLHAHVQRSVGANTGVSSSARQGLAILLQALPLLEELGDRVTLADGLASAASLTRWIGDFDASIERYGRAIALLESMEHRGLLPEAERGLAETLLAKGDFSGAAAHAERAMQLALPDDPGTAASTRMVLGRVRATQGRNEEARQLLIEAIELVERTTFRLPKWEMYFSLAEFCLSHGLREESEEWLTKTWAAIEPLGERAPMLEEIHRRLERARSQGAPATTSA